MFYSYLKLLILSTALLHSAPKVFDSLGNELETFQQDCKMLQKVSLMPTKIIKECNQFIPKANKAFKVGYKLDPYVDSDNISEKKLNKYLSLLRNLDKSKENILTLIYIEITKARKQNNIKYYSQLIAYDKIKLYSVDYEFMKKNNDIFNNNKRYISHLKHLKSLEESQKPILVEKQAEATIVKKKKKVTEKKLPLFVQKTDFIKAAGHMSKGYLNTVIFYQNRDSGERVFWENDKALIKCKAYENIGSLAYPKTGKELGTISKQTKRDGQSFYIKMKPTDKKRGILECNVNLHGKILTDKGLFLTREQ